MYNNEVMTLELKRIDVCDLCLACLAAAELSNDGGKKWYKLHDDIRYQLNLFDLYHFSDDE